MRLATQDMEEKSRLWDIPSETEHVGSKIIHLLPQNAELQIVEARWMIRKPEWALGRQIYKISNPRSAISNLPHARPLRAFCQHPDPGL
jgi:hypothetical protein